MGLMQRGAGAGKRAQRRLKGWPPLIWLALSLGWIGCAGLSEPNAGPNTSNPEGRSAEARGNAGANAGGGGRGNRGGKGGRRDLDQPPVVEILQATRSQLDDSRTYVGSTQPRRQVTLRSQLSAQLLSLNVEVGDRVSQGQPLGQLDAALLQAAVQEAGAELAVRQAELAQAKAKLAEVQTSLDEAKAQRQQARGDAARLRSLLGQGAIAQQQAELAQTELRVAEQRVLSAEAQLQSQDQAIAAAQQRLMAQQAVLTQADKQRTFTTLTASIDGVVLSRQLEAGDFVQSGQEILTLGDLGETLVVIEVTDQVRGQMALGKKVQVQLDALPGQSFRGTVSQISPVANGTSRLIPVEILLDTSEPLGSGLLARVNVSEKQAVVVPISAIAQGEQTDSKANQPPEPSGNQTPKTQTPKTQTPKTQAPETQAPETQADSATDPKNDPKNNPKNDLKDDPEDDPATALIFTLSGAGKTLKVVARPVTLGTLRNGQVEVLTGLTPGESYVAKSDRPLQSDQVVQRSLTSEF